MPGTAAGSGGAAASLGYDDTQSLRPLTVNFHETGFGARLAGENAQGFWFQMSGRQRQQATPPWGPGNPQALNRYSYVNNNPLKYSDPNGHWYVTNKGQAQDLLDRVNDALRDLRAIKGDAEGSQDLMASIVGSLISDLMGILQLPMDGSAGNIIEQMISSVDFGIDDAIEMFGFIGEELQGYMNEWVDGATLSIYFLKDTKGANSLVADHWIDRNKEGGHRKRRSIAVELSTYDLFNGSIDYIDQYTKGQIPDCRSPSGNCAVPVPR